MTCKNKTAGSPSKKRMLSWRKKNNSVILIIHFSSWQNTKSIKLFFGGYTVALPRHIWIIKASYNIYIYVILYYIMLYYILYYIYYILYYIYIYILYIHLIIKIIYISPYLWALYILISQLGGFLSHMATPQIIIPSSQRSVPWTAPWRSAHWRCPSNVTAPPERWPRRNSRGIHHQFFLWIQKSDEP